MKVSIFFSYQNKQFLSLFLFLFPFSSSFFESNFRLKRNLDEVYSCLKFCKKYNFIFHIYKTSCTYRTPKFFSICAERGGKRATNEVQWDVETKSFLIYDPRNIFSFFSSYPLFCCAFAGIFFLMKRTR